MMTQSKIVSIAKKSVKYFAVASLVAAYISGYFIRENDQIRHLTSYFPDHTIEKSGVNPTRYQIAAGDEMDGGITLILNTEQGWGGPFTTAVSIDTGRVIKDVLVLDHRETPSFFEKLVESGYFDQFKDKYLGDRFEIEHDVEAISGATVSSRAFSRSIGTSAHWIGRDSFAMDIIETPPAWNVGANEFIMIVLYTVVVISALKKYTRLRRYSLIFGMLFLGFYLNFPISVSNFSAIVLGYFPHIREYLFWYLLIFGTILLTLIFGKNFYCSWICPFGGMQEVVNLIGGVKIRLSKVAVRIAEKGVYFLFWLSFMIMFLTSNPSLGTFEPFATLFSLNGIGVQWYLVSVAVIGSFLLPRFWCRFFCPVGVVLRSVSRIRGQVSNLIQKKSISPSNITYQKKAAA